jgi:hypothetical protein
MGQENGVVHKRVNAMEDKMKNSSLSVLQSRMKNRSSINSEKQVRIDRILKDLRTSSDRMDHLLKVFNRIKRDQ